MAITLRTPPEADGVSVTSLGEARTSYGRYDGVVTIEDADFQGGLRIPAGVGVEQLVLRFDDLDFEHPRAVAVREDQLGAALEFARRFQSGKLLLHCHAGQCRSPGIALAVIAERMGIGREREAVAALLRIRASAAVNLLVLDRADRLLQRDGALKAAWMEHESGSDLIGRVRFLKRVAFEGGDCW